MTDCFVIWIKLHFIPQFF